MSIVIQLAPDIRKELAMQALQSPLLNLKEVAKLLNVPPKTIYYWVSRNELPYLRIGRHLRFDAQKVLHFLEEQTRARRIEGRRLALTSMSSRSLETREPGAGILLREEGV